MNIQNMNLSTYIQTYTLIYIFDNRFVDYAYVYILDIYILYTYIKCVWSNNMSIISIAILPPYTDIYNIVIYTLVYRLYTEKVVYIVIGYLAYNILYIESLRFVFITLDRSLVYNIHKILFLNILYYLFLYVYIMHS